MKKILFFILISYFSDITTNQELYEYEAENLIRFIKQKDKLLQDAQTTYKNFFKECTYRTYETRGNTTYTHTRIKFDTNYYRINEFYSAKDIIENFENRSIEEIQQYIQYINKIDELNKTPLEYVETSEMYNVLRSCGASFRLDSYIKIYPWSSKALLGSTLLTFVYMVYKSYKENLFNVDRSIETIPYINTKNLEDQLSKKEIDLTTQDKFGRTFLMNYLIQQNQQLEELNQKIKKLSQKSLELYEIQYSQINLLVTTEKNIQEMIEQQASIELYDCFNKNCLSYCTIKELRHFFEKSHNFYDKDIIKFISLCGFLGSIYSCLFILIEPKSTDTLS